MGSQKRNSKATSGLQLRRDESMGFFFAVPKGRGRCVKERERKKNVCFGSQVMVAEKGKGVNVITKVLHWASCIYKWLNHVKLST